MRNYEDRKLKIFEKTKDFLGTNDLTTLADIVIIASQLLKEEDFPFQMYKRWKSKNML